jgi:hypothetical protein
VELRKPRFWKSPFTRSKRWEAWRKSGFKAE